MIGCACSSNGDKRNVYSVLEVKLLGKHELGRERQRWEDIFKMHLREVNINGTGSHPMAGFCISSIEILGSTNLSP
jgi:hypothetical protein